MGILVKRGTESERHIDSAAVWNAEGKRKRYKPNTFSVKTDDLGLIGNMNGTISRRVIRLSDEELEK